MGSDRPEISVANIDGSGGPSQLTDADDGSWQYCRRPLWSPNGAHIGNMCGLDLYCKVYVMKSNGSNKVQLTDDSDDGHREDGALDCSPDSTPLPIPDGTRRKEKATPMS